ncbi:MAG: RNA methyltransferase [bacterium]|nr:RNA methyltransferase [bacterium]
MAQIEITSLSNELVKETVKLQQKKYRVQTGKFLLEGRKCVEEALLSGIKLESLFIDKNSDLVEVFKDVCDVVLTVEAVLKKISTTDSAPEIVAVGFQKESKFEDIKDAKKVLLLENIKDSGNLGTILRTSKAFGVDGVILFGDTIDLYNPKCVRSAVGNLWKLPVLSVKDFDFLKKQFADYERVATLPAGENVVNLKNYKCKEKVLLMFGSEADGLSDVLKNFATKNVTIEMDDAVESLNLAVSVAVFLYHLV